MNHFSMGQDIRYKRPVEYRRILWLIAITFCLVMVIHLELSYDNILSFNSSSHEAGQSGNGSFLDNGFSSNAKVMDNVNQVNDSNLDGTSGATDLGKENGAANAGSELLPKGIALYNESSRIDNEPPYEWSHARSTDSTNELEDSQLSSSGENVTDAVEQTLPGFSQENVDLVPEEEEEETSLDSLSNKSMPSNVESRVDKPANPSALHDDSSVTPVPGVKHPVETNVPSVISIAEMNDLLLQSQASRKRAKPRWSSPVDQDLLQAKSEILNAPVLYDDPILYAPLYRNVSMFKRSYELMEATLKVYIYKEGRKPVFHLPAIKGIYASEGWFMKILESNKRFVTKNPRNAHLFYLPFGSRNLEETLYVPNSHDISNLIQVLKDYLDVISSKHPYWNRTEGSDHFLVACHDWAPMETQQHMANCIRALCNSDIKEGFIFGKDVALPETNVLVPQRPLRNLGGLPPSKRSILAFFAGGMHGYVRPLLLKHWQNKDPGMKIFGQLPKSKGKLNYIHRMQSSKYCICPKGYEVNSPRVVEAIFYECVPVIISDNFVPPFFDILNWESFAVFVLEKDIPNLKNILLSIPEERYLEMQMRVKKVQKHFLWHARPVQYDLFHMILHSIWYSRVFQF